MYKRTADEVLNMNELTINKRCGVFASEAL